MATLDVSMPRVAPQARRLSPARRREALWGMLCVAPAVLGFLLWEIGPIVASLGIAFTDWNIVSSPSWVGPDNFRQIFTADELFWQALRVTVLYALASVPLRLLLAFALALLLNQKLPGLPFFRTIFYLPAIVPLIAGSVLWLWLFNPDFGLLNSLLGAVGLSGSQWIYDPGSVLPSLVLMSLWDVGPMVLIFLAGLQGVPRHLLEAVEVDGGNAWHRLRHITIPMVTPTILFNLILSIIGALQTFVQPYVMTDGGPNNASLFYVLYVVRNAFEQQEMGYAAALAWVLFVIIAVLSVLVFRTSNRWVYYEGER